jgi:phosphoglycolate phosphatase-like HAD superfamily hydrolase
MITDAAIRLGIDLTKSWMIGDILHDVEAGNRAGCKTILLDNGHETEWELSEMRKPMAIVSTFDEAVSIILNQRELV